MGYYLYLMPSGKSKDYLKSLWGKLQKDVEDKKILDLDSLKYPPHSSLTNSFEANDETISKLKRYLQDLPPFQTLVSHQFIRQTPYIVSLDFIWRELSQIMNECQKRFPEILFITNGYHFTLFHNSQQELQNDLYPSLSGVGRLTNDFDIVLWKTTEQYGQMYNIQSKKWEKLYQKSVK